MAGTDLGAKDVAVGIDRDALGRARATRNHDGVRSIPTLLLFKDGEVVESTVGVAGKEQLVALLDKHAAQKIA